jgi:hypothetical protein
MSYFTGMIESPTTFYLHTGQRRCYDAYGREIDCAGTGQDGEVTAGLAAPEPRFRPLDEAGGEVVLDRLTGLQWTADANPFEFPLPWQEALDSVAAMNRERRHGHDDWRMPNRRELRSLVDHAARVPALPAGHPFRNLFMGWYWTSTTAAPASAYAWYVHMEGGRMFYGGKTQAYMTWPVRGRSEVLPRTGQTECFDASGRAVDCAGTGQDGEYTAGIPWPGKRFRAEGHTVQDGLTRLTWTSDTDLAGTVLTWQDALYLVAELNATRHYGRADWRLPTINELESLVDCAHCRPALPPDAPFANWREAYWSSTTSFFEPDWAYCLYLHKGAVGVGYKLKPEFHCWAVAGPGRPE